MSKIIKNVSGKQKKQIDAAVKKARPNGNGKVPVTAQQSIPFKQMFKDGICKVDDNYYTKTVQFFDINYQLAQNEDKTAIFENYCDFLNYFDSSITVQLSFLNQVADVEEFHSQLEIGVQNDDFDDIRLEYSEMLKNQLAKGNNGLVKTKYITFGVKEKSLKEAKPKLERIEADILNNFKTMGVLAQSLNGAERLAVLHRSFNPDGREKFRFSWDILPKSGLSVKDFIAPSSFDFSKGNSFRMSGKYGAVSFINSMASEMSDRMLADFLNIEHNITLSIHIQSIDQNKAVKIKNLQDKVLPQLKQQLADTKGLFKSKERKALEVKIKETEAEIADRLDKIPDTLKENGYPDVQVFMRTFREMESVVEQYNRDLTQWEYQVSRKPTAAAKEQHRPPEKQSVLKHLREIQERNKQQPPQRQRKKSIDRDSR